MSTQEEREEQARAIYEQINSARIELEKNLHPLYRQLERLKGLDSPTLYMPYDPDAPWRIPIVDIPTDVVVAALKVSQYFAERGVKRWALCGMCSRD